VVGGLARPQGVRHLQVLYTEQHSVMELNRQSTN
jgi:hypothetical protein